MLLLIQHMFLRNHFVEIFLYCSPNTLSTDFTSRMQGRNLVCITGSLALKYCGKTSKKYFPAVHKQPHKNQKSPPFCPR